eukprot:5168502-Prymnesium_polylepis.1
MDAPSRRTRVRGWCAWPASAAADAPPLPPRPRPPFGCRRRAQWRWISFPVRPASGSTVAR